MNDKLIKKLKKDTNNSSYIIYRDKYIKGNKITIIYHEALTSSDKLSDFVIRSLDYIETIYDKKDLLYDTIINNITNIKVKKINNYEDLCNYLNNGFAIILIEDDYSIALETRGSLFRSIDKPLTENTIRGSIDSFNENLETNIGLVKRRIKSNNLWNDDLFIGRYTKTKISIFIFPTIMTTERPDKVCDALLNGKTVLLIDNSPFALIMPTILNDFFISEEDKDSKSINNTLTRILRYVAFFITIMTPGLYIAVITFNQEMLPLELLVSFSSQRSTVPFPAFFEALLMVLAFEILRESDLRIPNSSNSSLSIVGALILGEAAVSAGIVSPVMIIVEAITAISALLITEPELINAIRWYRLFFMIGATTLGMFGVFIVFIIFTVNLCSINTFGVPYTLGYAPLSLSTLKNSILKFPLKKRTKRDKFLTNNITREVIHEKD